MRVTSGRRGIVSDRVAKHHSRRVEVSALVRGLALPQLWSHEARGPRDLPRLRERGRILGPRDPEVSQACRAARSEEDVPRLDVAMDDPRRMDRLERAEDVVGKRLRIGALPILHAVPERAAGHVRHDDVRPLVVRVEVIDGDEVLMAEARCHLRLALEAGEPVLIGCKSLGEDLDRDWALEHGVIG